MRGWRVYADFVPLLWRGTMLIFDVVKHFGTDLDERKIFPLCSISLADVIV